MKLNHFPVCLRMCFAWNTPRLLNFGHFKFMFVGNLKVAFECCIQVLIYCKTKHQNTQIQGSFKKITKSTLLPLAELVQLCQTYTPFNLSIKWHYYKKEIRKWDLS